MKRLEKLLGIDEESQEREIRNQADRMLTIHRIDGIDYIFYDGFKVSTEEDAKDPAKLLNRLENYKQSFINRYHG